MKWPVIFIVVVVTVLLSAATGEALAQIAIVSPRDGITVKSGETIAISVNADAGVYKAVMLAASDGVITLPHFSPPYEFTLTAPRNTLEPIKVTAIGIMGLESGNTSIPITLNVVPDSALEALQTESTYVVFRFVGQQETELVHGVFANGMNIDIPSNALDYTSANANVATIQPGGLITAVGPGDTTVRMSYGGRFIDLKVSVPDLIRGDLTGNGEVDQDDLTKILAVLNTLATQPHDARDLNGDGKIDILDAQIEKKLCISNCVIPSIETTTTLVASPNVNLVVGQPLTLTATVIPAYGTAVPTGAVIFTDPAHGSITVSLDKKGQAIYVGVVPPAGTYSIFAGYSGDTDFAKSMSSTITRKVTSP